MQPATIPFQREPGEVTQKHFELIAAVDKLERLCQSHGKPKDQSIAAFVNEIAENLRSANDEKADIAEAAERLGYRDDGAESVATFLDALVVDEAESVNEFNIAGCNVVIQR